MGRLLRVGVAGVVLSLVVAVVPATSAGAVEPPPPPVTPAASLPSWSGIYYNPDSLPFGSPAYEEAQAAARAKLLAAGYPPPPAAPQTTASLKPAASLPFKPITPPAPFLRGVSVTGATSILGVAGMAGWAVGNGGLALYGVATGSDPWAAMCGAAPGPEQVLADIQKGVNFGIGPTCLAPVEHPNEDQVPLFTLASTGNAFRYGSPSTWCGSGSAALPAGEGIIVKTSTGGTTSAVFDAAPNSTLRTICSKPSGGLWRVGVAAPAVITELYRTVNGTKVEDANKSFVNHSRTPECVITWDDGSTTSAVGAVVYQESTGLPLSAAALGCKDAFTQKHPSGQYAGGALPTRIKVDSTAAGTKTTISDQNVGPATAEQKAALATASTAGLVLTQTIAGVTDSCMTWAANCSGWWAETSNGTVPTTGTKTYTCTFGGASVALAECGIYRHTFDVRTSTPTITDPVTGTEEQWVTAPATSNPGNTGNPGTFPNGSTDPHADCMASWPSAPDPISWVLHPVKCALVWAFVPREAEVTRLTGELTDMWEATGVGLTVNTVTAWEIIPPPEDGCSGILVPMSTMFGHGIEDFSILDACPGSPLEATAQWSFWIVLIGALINLAKSMTRNIGSIVGAKGVAESDES